MTRSFATGADTTPPVGTFALTSIAPAPAGRGWLPSGATGPAVDLRPPTIPRDDAEEQRVSRAVGKRLPGGSALKAHRRYLASALLSR